MKHIKKYNQEVSLIKEDLTKEINLKISNAAYSMRTFGTFTKQSAFINGAKWAIHNLSEKEIKQIKENTDPDDHSFFGFG